MFDYYDGFWNVPISNLAINHRSNDLIVNFTKTLCSDSDLVTGTENRQSRLEMPNGWDGGELTRLSKLVLDPEKATLAILHDSGQDTYSSNVEATIISSIIKDLYIIRHPKNLEDEKVFWEKIVGLVSPHRKQCRLLESKIFKELYQAITSGIRVEQFKKLISGAVGTVDKYQGSHRDFIIGSMGVSHPDKIEREEEFLFTIERLTVLVSRACKKLLIVLHPNIINHVPENHDTIRIANALDHYINEYCNQSIMMDVSGHCINVRWKEFNKEYNEKIDQDLLIYTLDKNGILVPVLVPLTLRDTLKDDKIPGFVIKKNGMIALMISIPITKTLFSSRSSCIQTPRIHSCLHLPKRGKVELIDGRTGISFTGSLSPSKISHIFHWIEENIEKLHKRIILLKIDSRKVYLIPFDEMTIHVLNKILISNSIN